VLKSRLTPWGLPHLQVMVEQSVPAPAKLPPAAVQVAASAALAQLESMKQQAPGGRLVQPALRLQ
jgi:hypothetical protein